MNKTEGFHYRTDDDIETYNIDSSCIGKYYTTAI